MGKTIVEKILAKAVGKPEVSPGEYVEFSAREKQGGAKDA